MKNLLNTPLNNDEWEEVMSNREKRLELISKRFDFFFLTYFTEHAEYKTPEFHLDMMRKASNARIKQLVVVGFRSCAKSTILSTAFPLWAVMGSMQAKFVVIISQTQNQANLILSNIGLELERNERLRKDVWPYEIADNEIGRTVINLPKYDAKIIAVGRDQGIRGLRHGPHRPDLIIADDVEDLASVRHKDIRNKTYDWYAGEVLGLGDENTKHILIGNLLHKDSLIMRRKEVIEQAAKKKQYIGEFVAYPLLLDGKPIWPSRFPTMKSVDRLKALIGNAKTWHREYLLEFVPEEQIITDNMIKRYPEIPKLLRNEYEATIVGVDLAITKNNRSDYTAMVAIIVRGRGKDMCMYVHPNPINKRLHYPEIKDQLKLISQQYNCPYIYVESVGFQASVPQDMQAAGLRNVKAVNPPGDKEMRLDMISGMIRDSIIQFPQEGAETLIEQLVGFGIEKHDDLVDALTIAVLEYKHKEAESQENGIVVIGHMNYGDTSGISDWDNGTDWFD